MHSDSRSERIYAFNKNEQHITMKNYVRKKLRLNNYDYTTSGCYFVTICTYRKNNLFGNVEELSEIGEIALDELLKIENRINDIRIDNYVIMPNHIHAIINIGCIEDDSKNNAEYYMNPTSNISLNKIVQLYKAGVTRRVHNEINKSLIVWQKSYYDVILNSKKRYDNAWYYIDNNPIEDKLRKSEFGFLGDD